MALFTPSQVGSVQSQTNPDLSIIYCNGIEATYDSAKEQAQIISSAFHGHCVKLVYNPAKSDTVYYAQEQSSIQQVAETALRLAREIRQGIASRSQEPTTHPQAKVLLFAHSHGAEITRHALLQLTQEEKALVDIYTFGPAAVIAKAMAHEVHNYLHDGDLLARNANLTYDSDNRALESFLLVNQRMKRTGCSQRQAIIEQFVEDKYQEMEPLKPGQASNESVRAFKVHAYGEMFFTGKPVNPLELTRGLERYTRCFTDYNIHLLPDPRTPNPLELPEAPLDLTDLAQIAAQKLSLFVMDSDDRCHKLESFQSDIQAIGQKILSTRATEDASVASL